MINMIGIYKESQTTKKKKLKRKNKEYRAGIKTVKTHEIVF